MTSRAPNTVRSQRTHEPPRSKYFNGRPPKSGTASLSRVICSITAYRYITYKRAGVYNVIIPERRVILSGGLFGSMRFELVRAATILFTHTAHGPSGPTSFLFRVMKQRRCFPFALRKIDRKIIENISSGVSVR